MIADYFGSIERLLNDSALIVEKKLDFKELNLRGLLQVRLRDSGLRLIQVQLGQISLSLLSNAIR